MQKSERRISARVFFVAMDGFWAVFIKKYGMAPTIRKYTGPLQSNHFSDHEFLWSKLPVLTIYLRGFPGKIAKRNDHHYDHLFLKK